MRRTGATRRDLLGVAEAFTFKGNLREARYGWLRLTPAYSVHLVADLLDDGPADGVVLDPFCGTGTTALVCAERGVAADTTDINPFLLWLTNAKTRAYSDADRSAFLAVARAVSKSVVDRRDADAPWTPPLHQIEKWWEPPTLEALGRAMAAIRRRDARLSPAVRDLLRVAFCRVMIDSANVSFGHQSMSFRKSKAASPPSRPSGAQGRLARAWDAASEVIAEAASSPIATLPRAIQCDARNLTEKLDRGRYACVVTSPPYPNRMSYIRELRPYMYWLGYLRDGRAAGALDWQAIGGTWGSATSNVGKWTPTHDVDVPFDGFQRILRRIAERSPLLSRYVHKYFHDMARHVRSLFEVVRAGGKVHYIVGNSKFYEVMLPVERIFRALFEAAGFVSTHIETIRKRTSKKELYEFVVSARKPMV